MYILHLALKKNKKEYWPSSELEKSFQMEIPLFLEINKFPFKIQPGAVSVPKKTAQSTHQFQ